MRVVIFANGDFKPNFTTSQALHSAAMIIAADNGARYCLDHGILPDVVIGDMDSLSKHMLQELEVAETVIIKHPANKDETDLELALDYALEHNASHITLLGGLGGRWDMSLSNIFLLSHQKYRQVAISIIGHDNVMHIINPSNPAKLVGRAGDTVSLLPLTPIAEGVSTGNLRFALQNESLYAASSRGVSNSLLAAEGEVMLGDGVLLCVHSLTDE